MFFRFTTTLCFKHDCAQLNEALSINILWWAPSGGTSLASASSGWTELESASSSSVSVWGTNSTNPCETPPNNNCYSCRRGTNSLSKRVRLYTLSTSVGVPPSSTPPVVIAQEQVTLNQTIQTGRCETGGSPDRSRWVNTNANANNNNTAMVCTCEKDREDKDRRLCLVAFAVSGRRRLQRVSIMSNEQKLLEQVGAGSWPREPAMNSNRSRPAVLILWWNSNTIPVLTVWSACLRWIWFCVPN